MTPSLAMPGDIVDLHAAETTDHATGQLVVLVRTEDVEIIQLFIPAGQRIPIHEAQGEVILHCVEGGVSVVALGESHELSVGQLLYLTLNEQFSMQGIECASVLATIITPKQGHSVELIGRPIPR